MHRNIALVAEQDFIAFIYSSTEANLTNNVVLDVECALKDLISVINHEKECLLPLLRVPVWSSRLQDPSSTFKLNYASANGAKQLST